MATDLWTEQVQVRETRQDDVSAILQTLRDSQSHPALLQPPKSFVANHFDEFVVATDQSNNVLGCAQAHEYPARVLEVLSVAVQKNMRGQGIGRRIVQGAVEHALRRRPKLLWLATGKPDFFSTIGFEVIPMRKIPARVILSKMASLRYQGLPQIRWVIFGKQYFMRYPLESS